MRRHRCAYGRVHDRTNQQEQLHVDNQHSRVGTTQPEEDGVMESKSTLFAKGTALRAQLEARGYEIIDVDIEVPEELKGMSMAQIYEKLKEQADD
jgi:hypothetical protein